MGTLSTNEKIAVFVGLAVIGLFFIVGPSLLRPFAGVFSETENRSSRNSIANVSDTSAEVTTIDTRVGEGRGAENGDRVVVHYTGELEDGTVFDSSLVRNAPFTFTLGAGQVIDGWEQGILGMRVGGERTLIIPPELGYGERGIGPIPGGATLIFDVVLVDIATE